MILVIGGMSSGRKTYVCSLGYAEDVFSQDPYSSAPVIYGVEKYVLDHIDSVDIADLAEVLAKKDVVICQEVGMGVIPVEYESRMLREKSGGLCTLLGNRADRIVRMICGIPTVIKG
jgi:adenosyl cobinamide kinase/adenosyl cobinamide phosphate guanylyltransferase